MRQQQKNFVAKYCCRFNKPRVEDTKKTYKRKEKHCKSFVDHLIVLA